MDGEGKEQRAEHVALLAACARAHLGAGGGGERAGCGFGAGGGEFLTGRASERLAGEVEAAGLTIPKVDGGGEMVEAGGGEATGDGLPGDGVEAVC